MSYNDEMTLVMIISLPMVAQIAYFSGYEQNILNDIVFQIMPVYLAVIFPGALKEIYAWLLTMLNLSRLRRSEHRESLRATVVDQERNTISICVTLAIYAADFSIFHPSLGKNDFFGLSFMDLGVGSFMYNAGLVSAVNTRQRYIRSSAFLILLGFVRLFTVRMCNLSVNNREYGVHSNFYFILAAVNLVYNLLSSEGNFAVGLLIILSYEFVLQVTPLKGVILSDDRDSFIAANKESIAAVVAYTSIFLIASRLSKCVFSKRSLRRKALEFINYNIFFAAMYSMAKSLSPASRRLGNATFVFWILMAHTVPLSFHLFMEGIVRYYEMPIPTFSSRNMMFIFLFSNLLVLAGNMLFDPKTLSTAASHAVLLGYMAAVFVVPTYLCRKFNCERIKIGF
jgi:glucosaminylphosphatidylinositol acyltransferase